MQIFESHCTFCKVKNPLQSEKPHRKKVNISTLLNNHKKPNTAFKIRVSNYIYHKTMLIEDSIINQDRYAQIFDFPKSDNISTVLTNLKEIHMNLGNLIHTSDMDSSDFGSHTHLEAFDRTVMTFAKEIEFDYWYACLENQNKHYVMDINHEFQNKIFAHLKDLQKIVVSIAKMKGVIN